MLMLSKRNGWQTLLFILLLAVLAYISVQHVGAYASAESSARSAAQVGAMQTSSDLACVPTAYSLEELVDCITSYMPAEGSGGYITPTVDIQDDWRTVVQQMMDLTDINGCSNVSLPDSLDDIYDVFAFSDAFDDKQYCVAMEVEDANDNHVVDRGWGTFIVNPTPERYLSIDIPHPIEDSSTNKQGIAVFKGVGAQTFIMAGSNRYANSQESPCQDGEKVSDVAHCIDNFFFPTVVEIDEYHTTAGTDHTAIQFHGMTSDGCPDVNIYLTHGSADAPQSNDPIVSLKANLLAEQSSWSVAVPGESGKFCDKNGTNNVEGRYLNIGDETQVCGSDATTYTGKFIHIEQDPDSDLNEYRNPDTWIKALKNTFAPLTPPDPTTTLSFQDGVWPDATYAGTADTMIRVKYADNNYGAEASCEAAGDGFVGLAKEVALRWDVSDVPDGSTVQEALVTLNVTDDTVAAGYYAYQLQRDWIESEATWNQYRSGSNWELPGAQGTLDRNLTPIGKLIPTDPVSYTFSLNPNVVQSWLDTPSTNYGILIANPDNSNRVIFDCRETSVAANRPMLTIRYSQDGDPTTPTPTPTTAPTPTPTATPAPGGETIYFSSSTSDQAGGVSFSDEDIVAYDTANDTWSLYLDGTDVGLNNDGARDSNAFYVMDDGSILISVYGATTLPDVGAVDDSDIVRFVPTVPGDNSAGSFTWYFDGSDVGLDSDAEDIVAMALTDDGKLVISTRDDGDVGFAFDDDDLLQFDPATLGADTTGTWSLLFEGSDVGLGGEDIRGLWIESTNGTINNIYFTLLNEFSPAGDKHDIFVCTPGTLGANTTCTTGPALYWDGSAHGISTWRPDGLHIQR